MCPLHFQRQRQGEIIGIACVFRAGFFTTGLRSARRRRFPRQFARSDRLSGDGDRERQARDDPISGVPAVSPGQIDI
jgi:hypothetical protein